MTRAEKVARLKAMLRQMSDETAVETLPDQESPPTAAGLESMPAGGAIPDPDEAKEGVRKLQDDRDDDVTDTELLGLEAIVMKQGRPAVFIRNNRYETLTAPWTGLNAAAVRNRLQPLFPSIGRVELPNDTRGIPYGGTGFVVGPGLLMTNRHVAALFAQGLGTRLTYQAGDAAVDFKREVDSPEDDQSAYVVVREVAMVHPFWDMALLRVDGLPAASRPLRLSVARPEDLLDRDVAAVGYPARDPRNDLTVQDRIFSRTYDVKRFQPGKFRRRSRIRSFENTVSAATHDSSTLGGNSGSAIIDVATGDIIGLHFAGVYLEANYAVPAYELARDARVVEAGVNFAGRVPATREWDAVWDRVNGEQPRRDQPPAPQPHAQTVAADGAMTWTIPLRFSVSFGTPVLAAGGAAPTPAAVAAPTEARMQVPFIAPDLESRAGYQPDFITGVSVPLPDLTANGKKVAAKLDDGTTELKYHHFSVVMHKKRRLALVTAANVDWQKAAREVDGRKPTRRELTGLDDNAQEQWVTDPRIPDGHQLPDVFFTKDGGSFDKGHIVRRDDVAWGDSFDDMRAGNGDTYHTTNCSPQVAGFNRSANGEDNWGDLENMVQKETKAERVCVFAGPVLADDDRTFRGRDERGPAAVKIPRKYWKVIVAAGDDGPKAYGFVLEQDLSGVPVEVPPEFAVPPPWKRYMLSIGEIEAQLGGLVKLTWLKQHDAADTDEGARIAEQAAAGSE